MAPKITLGDDFSMHSRFVCVSGEGFVGFKVQIALDGEAELAADGGEFAQTDVSEFWASQA